MGFPRSTLLATVVAGLVMTSAQAAELPYGLKEGKPYDGTMLNIFSVITPQFDGLMLRDSEFTELTGIETEWTFIPFGSLQEKVTAEGIAANRQFDVINYLDSWGPPDAHWLESIDEWVEADGISMDRYPAAFAKSAQSGGADKILVPGGTRLCMLEGFAGHAEHANVRVRRYGGRNNPYGEGAQVS